jgi:hypothetical protein
MSSISMKGLTPHLEPRVVRLESDMASLVQGQVELRKDVHEISEQISKLTVAVTQVSGPHRTDWGLLIAILTFIVSIGVLTIAPLYAQQTQTVSQMRDHVAMPLHHVGQVEIANLADRNTLLDAKYTQWCDDIQREHKESVDSLDKKLQQEFWLAQETTKTMISELDIRLQREINLITDRADARLSKVESWITTRQQNDFEELRKRRLQDDCIRKNEAQ